MRECAAEDFYKLVSRAFFNYKMSLFAPTWISSSQAHSQWVFVSMRWTYLFDCFIISYLPFVGHHSLVSYFIQFRLCLIHAHISIKCSVTCEWHLKFFVIIFICLCCEDSSAFKWIRKNKFPCSKLIYSTINEIERSNQFKMLRNL